MADALRPLIFRRAMPLESMSEAELLKLHRQFNHPSDDKLQALLKRAGVPDAIVAKAAGIASKCPSTRCHVRQAIRRPVTGFPKASRFRELLIFDVFTISHGHDARIIRSDPAETYSVLGCIDWATRWQKCYIIPDQKAQTILSTLLDHFAEFGKWSRIQCDPHPRRTCVSSTS